MDLGLAVDRVTITDSVGIPDDGVETLDGFVRKVD